MEWVDLLSDLRIVGSHDGAVVGPEDGAAEEPKNGAAVNSYELFFL